MEVAFTVTEVAVCEIVVVVTKVVVLAIGRSEVVLVDGAGTEAVDVAFAGGITEEFVP